MLLKLEKPRRVSIATSLSTFELSTCKIHPALRCNKVTWGCSLILTNARGSCHLTSPLAIAVEAKHYVRCYHHDKVAAIDQTVDHFARFQADSKKLLSVGAG